MSMINKFWKQDAAESVQKQAGFGRRVTRGQTPRRWGWGIPLKKRAATRTKISTYQSHLDSASTSYEITGRKMIWRHRRKIDTLVGLRLTTESVPSRIAGIFGAWEAEGRHESTDSR